MNGAKRRGGETERHRDRKEAWARRLSGGASFLLDLYW